MPQNVLEKSLAIVARVIAERYDGVLDVYVGGNSASTDGNSIFLPPLPETKEAGLLARGFIDHEAAHIRYTDFGVKFDDLTNAIEDVRIEELISQQFIGAKMNLKALAEWFANNLERPNFAQTPDYNVLAGYVHFKLRRDVLFNYVGDIVDSAEKELDSRFGKAFKDAVDKIIKPRLRSTPDCKRRAKALLALLNESRRPQKNRPGQQGRQGQDKNQDGQGQDESQGPVQKEPKGKAPKKDQGQDSQLESSSAKPGEMDNRPGDTGHDGSGQDAASEQNPDQEISNQDNSGIENCHPNDPASTETEGKHSGAADSLSGGSETPNVLDVTGGKESVAIRDGFEGVGEAAQKRLNVLTYEAEREDDLGLSRMQPAQKHSFASIDPVDRQRLEKARSRSAQLRRKLQIVLEARRRDEERLGYAGKRVSRSRLHRLRCGDSRVFSRKIEHKAINTAVHLLVDISSSMKDNGKLENALDACYALGAALDKMQYVNLAISTFPDLDSITRTYQIKAFNEPLKIERFGIAAGGGTPTDEGMLYAAYTLALQPEPRKIIFIVTDGEPNHPERVQKIERWLNERGVEVFALGAACPIRDQEKLLSLFRRPMLVDNLDELAPTIFATLQKEL